MKFNYKGFMEDVKNYFKDSGKGQTYNLRKKALVYILSLTIATPFSVSCGKTKKEVEERFIPVTNEARGVGIMMSECIKHGLSTTRNETRKEYHVWFEGKQVGFIPDYLIEKNNKPDFAYGEFISPSDNLTSEQELAIKSSNSTPGTAKGKTVLAGSLTQPQSEEQIIEKVKKQITEWGLID